MPNRLLDEIETKHEKDNNPLMFIPNEIFTDLRHQDISFQHQAFAYSYHYLINYLYRYTKYGYRTFTQKEIIQMIGCSPDNMTTRYIIKNNGLLDKLGYTRTMTDFPIAHEFDSVSKDLTFSMYSDYKKENTQELRSIGLYNVRKPTIKYPVKAFYRSPDSEKENIIDGTFFDIENSHAIPIKIFREMMGNTRLGIKAFYIYSYLRYRIACGSGQFSSGMKNISKLLSATTSTFNNYKNILEDNNYIDIEHRSYYQNTDYQPNTYTLGSRR